MVACSPDKDDGISYGSLYDSRDDKTYKTMQIGKQVWMVGNLNYNASGSTCYKDSNSNCDKYGRLYNWETAMTICPEGWHLPSDEEWVAATTDSVYTFPASPGGYSLPDGYFNKIGEDSYWWSATEYDADGAYYWRIPRDSSNASKSFNYKTYLFSVRCVQGLLSHD